uniref:HTH OST-type domain-containing protein n=1 Tax=Meloidogyne floridensis TaxID=298350 RepID=A0A915PG63_9BILA
MYSPRNRHSSNPNPKLHCGNIPLLNNPKMCCSILQKNNYLDKQQQLHKDDATSRRHLSTTNNINKISKNNYYFQKFNDLQQQQQHLNFIRKPNLIENYFIREQQQKQPQQLINIKRLFLFPQTSESFFDAELPADPNETTSRRHLSTTNNISKISKNNYYFQKFNELQQQQQHNLNFIRRPNLIDNYFIRDIFRLLNKVYSIMARSESFFDAELPADPSSSYRHISTTNYNNYVEDEEDIGLDYGVEVNDENDDLGFGDDEEEEEDDLGLLPPGPPSRHFGNYEEEEEDDEIGLNRMPPMPDEEDDIFGDPKTSTPAPQDPTINNENVNYDMMNVPFKDFAKEVVYTVASKCSASQPIGYCNVHELREDLRKDTGLLPDYVVAHYGFPNFETFMKSELMKDYVRLQLIEGKNCFLPRDCERFAHIRNEQEIERAATLLAEATLKGRKLISELVYELGGQDNPVSWTSVQKKYKEKYNEELAGEALKRMFTRDKAIKILETLFNYELQLFQANLPGHFFLQLKMPYNDLLNYYETELQNHNEAKAQMKNVTGRALRPKGNYPKQPKVFPTGPLYPTFVPPPPPVQPIKKSLDVPTDGGQTNIVNNNVSTSNQPSLPTTSNAAPKKSKFDISPEEIGLSSTKKQSSFTEMINDEEDIAEERKITVKYNRKGWEEESSVPAYEIGGGGGESGTAGGGGMEKPSRLDTPINQNGNNGKNGVVEGEAAVENNKKKKTRYTSRIVGQDFTDSEESGDDEDEIVSVKQREGQQNVISNQKPDGENLTSFVPQPVPQPTTISSSTTFVPPPRLSGHRAGIHKFMQEKVEQRKMEGASTTTQQQPNQPSLKPKIKRYPVNYSSDEYDEDDNIFNEQQKPREKEKSVENIFGGRVEQQQGGGGIGTNNNSTTMFNSSLPSQQPQQQPTSSTRHLSTFSSSSINQQQQQNNVNASTFNSPQKNVKIDSEWLLVDKVEWLRNEANKQKMSHESR